MLETVWHSIVWAIVVMFVCGSVIWAIAWSDVSITKVAMENGYTRKTLQGVSGSHWVKE